MVRSSFLIVMLGMVVVAGAIPSTATAEAWTSVVTACQERLINGSDDDLTFSSSMSDGGNRAILADGVTGYRYLWCPVWVPSGTYFNRIQVRAFDNTSTLGNDVWSGFYRQPWTSGSGNATSLGSVTSANSANLPNVTEASITATTIANDTYTYYVIVRIGRTSSGNEIRAYQVKLHEHLGLMSEAEPPVEPMDCGAVEATPEWQRTAEETERCILPSFSWR